MYSSQKLQWGLKKTQYSSKIAIELKMEWPKSNLRRGAGGKKRLWIHPFLFFQNLEFSL